MLEHTRFPQKHISKTLSPILTWMPRADFNQIREQMVSFSDETIIIINNNNNPKYKCNRQEQARVKGIPDSVRFWSSSKTIHL